MSNTPNSAPQSQSPPPLSSNTTTTSNSDQPPTEMPPFPPLKFGPFSITPQVFHLSPSQLSYGLINIKPLLPGHVLIVPVRRVARLSQLSATETSDLFLTVRRVSRTIERVYKADALNVAVQDGVAAGQSVPHVHVHVIPRRKGDMDARGGGDRVYEQLEGNEGDVGGELERWREWRERREKVVNASASGTGIGERERIARSEEDMRKEAEWLWREMEKDGDVEGDYLMGSDKQ